MTFGEKLKQIRNEKGMSQQDFADLLHTSKQVISRYELGQTTPKIGVAANMCQILGVNLDNMINDKKGIYDAPSEELPIAENIIPMPKMKKVPLLGTIACGEPILAEENIESYVNMPEGVHGTFALKCKGDSMINARIFNGDIVYIRQQPNVENGEIAAVLIDNEATLKKVYQYPNRLELRAENPTFAPLEYEGEAMNNIRILGKAVYFVSKIR